MHERGRADKARPAGYAPVMCLDIRGYAVKKVLVTLFIIIWVSSGVWGGFYDWYYAKNLDVHLSDMLLITVVGSLCGPLMCIPRMSMDVVIFKAKR